MIAAQKKKNIGNLSRHFHNSKCNQKVTGCNQTKNEKTLEIQGFDWWSVGGSNPWPQDCEPCALPAELMALMYRKKAGSKPKALLMRVYNRISVVCVTFCKRGEKWFM